MCGQGVFSAVLAADWLIVLGQGGGAECARCYAQVNWRLRTLGAPVTEIGFTAFCNRWDVEDLTRGPHFQNRFKT